MSHSNLLILLVVLVILFGGVGWRGGYGPGYYGGGLGLVLVVILLFFLFGCSNLPQRTYSLQYTDAKGRSIGGGVTLGDTRGYAK